MLMGTVMVESFLACMFRVRCVVSSLEPTNQPTNQPTNERTNERTNELNSFTVCRRWGWRRESTEGCRDRAGDGYGYGMMSTRIFLWYLKASSQLNGGVIPPTLGSAQSSILSAPFRAAYWADWMLKHAISRWMGMVLAS